MTGSHRRSLSEERINKRKKTGRRTGRGSQACPRRSPRGKTGGGCGWVRERGDGPGPHGFSRRDGDTRCHVGQED